MTEYFLQTKRLGFRLWAETDTDLATQLWGDIEVTKLIGGPFSPEWIQERLAKEMRNFQEFEIQYWQIFLLATGDHVGCCGLKPYEIKQGIYEIGFHLKPAFHGQGLAPEAAQAVIDYAFNRLKATALFAGNHPDNEPSRRVLERLGFRYTHDELFSPTGLCHRSYLLSAEEYRKRFASD